MICTLTAEQEKILLKKVFRDLYTMLENNTPFELKGYVKSIYDTVKKAKGDEALAQTYAALIPKNLLIAYGVDKDIRKHIKSSILALQDLEESFENFDNIATYLDLNLAKKAEEAKSFVEIMEEREAEKKAVPQTVESLPFSALPNTLNSTTGDDTNVALKSSYDFLRKMISNSTVNSEVSGYYLTLMKASDLLSDEEIKQLKLTNDFIQVITDSDGNVIKFDTDINESETGNPVLFEFRTQLNQIQTKAELAHSLKLMPEQVDDIVSKQLEEIANKTAFLSAGTNRKVIQKINGASLGFINVNFKNPLPLQNAEDLTVRGLKRGTEKNQTGRNIQVYQFDRGPHLMPVSFRMNRVTENMTFINDAVDILFNEAVDENGSSERVKLDVYTKFFFDVFFGNNNQLAYTNGKLLINGKEATSKEEIKEALLYNTVPGFNDPTKLVKVANTFNVYKTSTEVVPFYTKKEGKIVLSINGLSGREYRKFLQDNSFTYVQYDKGEGLGKFRERNGYLTFDSQDQTFLEGATSESNASAIKPGVEQLFESNPELANAVYQALGLNEFASDLRSQIVDRLRKEGISQEERNKLTGTQTEPKLTSLLTKDIDSLIESYKENKKKQLDEFATKGDGFNSESGNFVNNDTSWWDNKIDKLVSIKQKGLELYSQYLDTVFPDSKVKDIVYHGTNETFEKFEHKKEKLGASRQGQNLEEYTGLIWFSDKDGANHYGKSIAAVLNMTNPANGSEYIMKYSPYDKEDPFTDSLGSVEKSFAQKDGYDSFYGFSVDMIPEKIVFEPEQIHILGNKEDIEGFKKFTAKPTENTTHKKEFKKFTKKGELPSTDVVKSIINKKTLDKLKEQKIVNEEVTVEQIEAAKKWFEKSPLAKHVSFNQMFDAVNSSNPKSIATFVDAGITLYKGSDFTDLYHEAWHAFSQMFLTQKELDSLYKAVRTKSGTFLDHNGKATSFAKATDDQIEEYLAEQFREFMLKDGKVEPSIKKAKSLFQKILDILKLLFNFQTEDILSNNQASIQLNELFEKLRIGNIRTLPVRNTTDTFNKIKAVSDADQNIANEIGYKKAMQIVDSIDALFSQYIDNEVNKGSAVKYTASLLSNPETRAAAYNYALSKMIDEHASLVDKLEVLEETDPTYPKLLEKQELLAFAISNFSEASTDGEFITAANIINAISYEAKGVLAYHLDKSKYLSFEDRFEVEEEQDLTADRDGFSHKSGNEQSMKELAEKEVLYLIRSLFDYNAGKLVKNDLGFPKLASFDTSWNKIQRLLSGITNADEMYKKLLAAKDPAIKQLVSKLGPPNLNLTKDSSFDNNVLLQNALWTNFWKVFSAVKIPLIQLTVDVNSKDGSVTIKPGNAQAATDKISRDWDVRFSRPDNPNKYIISKVTKAANSKDKFRSNFLDIASVIRDFESSYDRDPVRFLHAIGILVSDMPEIEKALKNELKVFPKAMMEILKKIHYSNSIEENYNKKFVNSPSDLIKFEVNGKTEAASFKELLNLEAKYSDIYATSIVSNAEGSAQWEYSKRSTVSTMIDLLNKATSYQDLISNPLMSHLDVTRNPFIKNLFIMKELFGENLSIKSGETVGSGREKSARIVLENSSGVSVTVDQEFANLGIASANADEVTQLLQNFYTMLLYGVSESTRHADKSTTYLYKMVFSGGRKHYIDPTKFAIYRNLNDIEEARSTTGNIEALNQFVNYLGAEIARISKLKNGDPSGSVTVGNKTYAEVGTNFVIFQDILSEKTKEQLQKKFISEKFIEQINQPKNARLLNTIQTEILNYFDSQVEAFRKDAAQINLTGNSELMKAVRAMIYKSRYTPSQLKEDPTKEEFIDEAIFRAYVLNDWIHKFETTSLLYGDIALYNMAKEEFHKRNAGIAATGDMARTDESILSILNQSANKYSDSVWFKSSGMTLAEEKTWTKTMNTAVMQDVDSKSIYIEDYINSVINIEKQRLGDKFTDELANKIRKEFESGAYAGMTEGDGQGWIAFDSYRALLISLGKWSSYQEDMFNRILSGEDISAQDIARFFPVKKMQYWGPLQTKGLPVYGFHKFSLMPLIPNVIKGTNLEILHNKMVSQGIDYSMFQSGSKVNTVTNNGVVDKFYIENDRNNLNDPAFAADDFKFTKNVIFLDYFKDQLETADKYKGKVPFSTQLRKLVEEGLMEQGVPTDFRRDIKDINEKRAIWETSPEMTPNYQKLLKYEELVKELTEYKINELRKDLGIDNGGALISEKLIDFVKKELSRQDLADHEIDFIQYDPVTKGLVHDLSFHPSADKIEKLLSALVYKRLVKQKVNGEPLIQVSGAGFEPAGLRKPTQEEAIKYGTNNLPFYHLKDGKTQAMKVKIAIQGDFKKLLNHPDVIEFSRLNPGVSRLTALNVLIKQDKWLDDNRQLITIAGVRIPVQGLNSMEFAEVFEFLPENAGNIIIVPAEIVAKSGSDFDIDKLTIMFPNISKIGNNVFITKYDKNKVKTLDANKQLLKELYEQLDIQTKILIESKFQETESGEKVDAPRVVKDAIKKYKLERKEIAQKMEEAESEEEYNDLLDEWNDTNEHISNLFLTLSNRKEEVRKFKEENIDPIKEEILSVKFDIDEASSKGIENSLLQSVIDIISMPENFVELITPNSTDLVKPLADSLSEFVRPYNAYSSITLEDNKPFTFTNKGKEQKVIAGTRIFELGYNRYKQSSNSIGKRTLGQGAVDNTYNTLFNRIGAYMNPTAEIGSGKNALKDVKQVIRMPHNKFLIDGKEAISLSNLYDVEGNNRIATLISQMINGWVDVAKDAWIFDMQGVPELSGTLLFMIQAGVPLEQAVKFISQPIIREYVKHQRLIKSTFAKPLKADIKAYNMFRNEARKKILLPFLPESKPVFNVFTNKMERVKDVSLLNPKAITKNIYDLFIKANLKDDENIFTIDALQDNLVRSSRELKETGRFNPSNFDLKVFLHFIELEEMAKATTKVKLAMNVDTSKSGSIFQAREKLATINALNEEKRFPVHIIEKIETESPIGSFKIQQDLIDMVSGLFPNRDTGLLNAVIRDEADQRDDQITEFYGPNVKNKEDLINKLRNDFTNYVFQSWLYNVKRFKKLEDYKGSKVSTVVPVAHLKQGIFGKNGKLYADFSVIDKDFDTNAYASEEKYWTKRGLAPVSEYYFSTPDQLVNKVNYYKFLYERETLRQMVPFETYKESADFEFRKNYVRQYSFLNVSDYKTKEEFEKAIEHRAYEEYLKDTALMNKLNIHFLFRDKLGFAGQIAALDQIYPDLLKKYDLIKSLIFVDNRQVKNLRLSELSIDADLANIYHDELSQLADPNVMKVENPLDNQKISNLFTTFAFFAFIQAGQDGKNMYSLAKIVNTNKYSTIMEKVFNEMKTELNNPDFYSTYVKMFKDNYKGTQLEEGSEFGDVVVRRSKKFKDYTRFNNRVINKTSFIKIDKTNPALKSYGTLVAKVRQLKPGEKLKEQDTNAWAFNSGVQDHLKKNPNDVFIFDDSAKPYSKLNTANVFKKGEATAYNTSIFKDLIANKKVKPENAAGLVIKNVSVLTSKDELVTDATYDLNVKKIDASIENIKKLVASGKNLVFSETGHGASLLGYGRTEKTKLESNQLVKTPNAPKTFVYLTKRLFEEFGYVNPIAKNNLDAIELFSSKQEVKDSDVTEALKCFYK